MLIDVCSDLHVDINNDIPLNFSKLKNEDSKIIVIAGDIANTPREMYEIVKIASDHYEHVVFVDGNHEHYDNKFSNRTITETSNLIDSMVFNEPRIHYLNGKNSFRINELLFVGANGWYDFGFAPRQYKKDRVRSVWMTDLNDYRFCNFDMEPEDFANLQADQIIENVSNAQNDSNIEHIILVTHTVSNARGIKFTGEPNWDMLSGAFGNSQMKRVFESDVSQKINYAICGHTHFKNYFTGENTTWIINPRGYHHYDGDVTKWFMVQIDTDQTF